MAHLALYREWRPQTFADLVGQKHVVRTLKNALVAGRFAHAYLLSGPRGTGKTTVARLIAKALNCLDPKNGEPCNECAACVGIQNGTSMDLIELDAASNRGIGEIKDLLEKVKFAPTELKHKVYIIDEVHMLTEPAFNALLKTLEEPPPRVVFVLATTDPHKLPITIVSRCQRFDFHRLAAREVVQRLQLVCDKYGLQVAPEALAAVARQSEGGMRDALSLLDQVMAYAEPGAPISLDDALAVLGAAPLEQFVALDGAVAGADPGAALMLLDGVARQGKDLRQFVRDYLAHLRDLLLIQVIDDPSQLVDVPETAVATLKDQADRFSRDQLLAVIKVLATLESDLKFAASPRLLVEIALIRLCAPGGTELAAPASVAAAPQPAPAGAPRAAAPVAAPSRPPLTGDPWAETTAAPAPTPAPDPAPATPQATNPATDQVREVWPRLLELLSKKYKVTAAQLRNGTPVVVLGNKLYVSFEHKVHADLLQRGDHCVTIEKGLDYLGLKGLKVTPVEAKDVPAVGAMSVASAPAAPAAPALDDLTARWHEAVGGQVEIKEEDHR